MFYDKKTAIFLCLSICFSLSADDCSVTNVQSKADQLQKDANTLKANAAKLQDDANTLKNNAAQLKIDVKALQSDYLKLQTLQQNFDALDDAVVKLTALSSPQQ